MMSAMSSAGSIREKRGITTPPTDFVFKIKDIITTTTAGTGYSTTYNITNTGGVAIEPMVGTRTNVVSFSGSNYLRLSYALPATFTQTFWLSTPATITTTQVVWANTNYAIQFIGTSYLKQNFAGVIYTSTVIQPVSTWQFYCIIMTPTAGKMYVNGAYVGSQSFASWIGTTSPITLGASNVAASRYTGYTDDTRLYERELSPAEIAALYAAG